MPTSNPPTAGASGGSHDGAGTRGDPEPTPADPRAGSRERYERLSAYPIFVLCLAFIVGFFMRIASHSQDAERAFGMALLAVAWMGFVVDYVISVALAANRRQFVARHIFLLAAIILPPLRLMLIFRALSGLVAGSRNRFGGRLRAYVLYLTTLLVVASAILEVYFERMSPEANIRSLGDAVWWVAQTLPSVGYGDYYPVTVGGRIVAVVLFVNGVALLSVVTATLASRVIEDAGDKGEDARVTLNDLDERLRSIERALAALGARGCVTGAEQRGVGTDGPS